MAHFSCEETLYNEYEISETDDEDEAIALVSLRAGN